MSIAVVWCVASIGAIRYGADRWRHGERWLGGASIVLGSAIALGLVTLFAFPDLIHRPSID